MSIETPRSAVITAPFDLGLILEFPNGRTGMLRTPEMSEKTAQWERDGSGVGKQVSVYVVREIKTASGGYDLLSEFSAQERADRIRDHGAWLKAQEQVQMGTRILTRIRLKLPWGCLCRQEAKPFLEGVIPAPENAAKHDLPMECAISQREWDELVEGRPIAVFVSHRRRVQWGDILYFAIDRS